MWSNSAKKKTWNLNFKYCSALLTGDQVCYTNLQLPENVNLCREMNAKYHRLKIKASFVTHNIYKP